MTLLHEQVLHALKLFRRRSVSQADMSHELRIMERSSLGQNRSH